MKPGLPTNGMQNFTETTDPANRSIFLPSLSFPIMLSQICVSKETTSAENCDQPLEVKPVALGWFVRQTALLSNIPVTNKSYLATSVI
jgi:hypothetical protein